MLNLLKKNRKKQYKKRKPKGVKMFQIKVGDTTPWKSVCACVNFTEIGLMNRVFRACLFRNMAVKRSTSHMCLWSKIIS